MLRSHLLLLLHFPLQYDLLFMFFLHLFEPLHFRFDFSLSLFQLGLHFLVVPYTLAFKGNEILLNRTESDLARATALTVNVSSATLDILLVHLIGVSAVAVGNGAGVVLGLVRCSTSFCRFSRRRSRSMH